VLIITNDVVTTEDAKHVQRTLKGILIQPGRKHHHPDECFRRHRDVDFDLRRYEKLVIEPLRHPMRQTGVMDSFDVFGNVILCSPHGLAYGACRLPDDAGLIYKVLGRETTQVKGKIRAFWAIARKEITGADLPPPFFWR
jgi:urease accessory protein